MSIITSYLQAKSLNEVYVTTGKQNPLTVYFFVYNTNTGYFIMWTNYNYIIIKYQQGTLYKELMAYTINIMKNYLHY